MSSAETELPVPLPGGPPPVAPPPGGALVHSGAELVELGERFFRGVFVGCLVFVGFSSAAALALLPLRDSDAGYGTVTVPLVIALLLATPFAVWRARDVDRALRGSLAARIAVVAVATAFVAYPLRSELWWPSCALVMLLATVTGVRGAIGASLVVLLTNLLAHVIAGDLDETPAVSIIGLWIGYGFWATAFALVPDRLTADVLRVNAARRVATPPPRRVDVTVVHEDGERSPADPPPQPAEGAEALRRLTARQLQVVALLADGCRYDEIAACLAISERQVQRHVSQAVERVGVRNANELVARAVAWGLVG